MVDSAIKNLIFDLGGVIINLEVENTIQAFASLGKLPSDVVRQGMKESFFIDYEKGALSSREFRGYLRKWMNQQLTDEQLDMAWNAMLMDIPAERITLLHDLRPRYRTFLLSNTNEIHLTCFNQIVKKSHGQDSLDPYFYQVYYSHQIKMRKPDREIYEMVISENKLMPEETLFMDDNLANLEGARQIGIQTFHVQNPNQLFTLFS